MRPIDSSASKNGSIIKKKGNTQPLKEEGKKKKEEWM